MDKKDILSATLLSLALGVTTIASVNARPQVTGIKILPQSEMIATGESTDYKIEYKYNNPYLTQGQKTMAEDNAVVQVKSKSDNIEVKGDTIKGIKEGNGQIEGILNYDKTYTANVKVKPSVKEIHIDDMELNTDSESTKPTVKVEPENAVISNITYKIIDGDAITISYKGEIKTKHKGEATVEASIGKVSTTFKVTVLQSATGIEADDITMSEGEVAEASFRVLPEDAQANTNILLTSSDEDIVSVNEDGTITAHKQGEVTLTGKTLNGHTTTSTVKVTGYPLHYKDDTLEVTVYKEMYAGTWCYLAHVQTTDYNRMSARLANDIFDTKETTSSIANRLGAVLAINGDYIGAGNTYYPSIKNGQVVVPGTCNTIAVYSKATGLLSWPDDLGITGKDLSSLTGMVTDTYQFAPCRLLHGEVIPGGYGVAQRTFMGTNGAPGDWWLCLSDGRYNDGVSAGLTETQVAQLLKDKGCTFGVMLDGGGSSTIVFKGKTLNANKYNERAVNDFVIIK